MTLLYEVFGGRLESPVEIPELPRATAGPVTWQFEICGERPPNQEAEELGSDVVFGDVRVRCFRSDRGLSLVFDDTGRFDVLDHGRRIVWYREVDARDDAARQDLASRVLALALHARGVLSLHASALSLDGAGIALMGPKRHGKSTLAAALVARGARFLTDDTLAVDLQNACVLRPGVFNLRLWRDSAEAVHKSDQQSVPAAAAAAGKLLIRDMRVERSSVPFGAAYVLHPVPADPVRALVERTPFSSMDAALALVQHSKLGPLLRRSEAGVLFTQAAAVAQRVPIFGLSLQRDLSRLDEVAAMLLDWHRDGEQPSRT